MADETSPATVDEVIARLEALVADWGGKVQALPGMTADELAAWPIDPPEEIRAFFTKTRGFTFARYVFDFNHKANHTEAVEGDYYPLRNTTKNWVLDDGMGHSTTYYVDIDPESGAWGRVFSFWRDPYACLVAPSFFAWLDNLMKGTRLALEASRGDEGDPARAFADWTSNDEESLFRGPDDVVTPMSVPAALASGDAELAEVAALLPRNAYLADLRTAGYPTEVAFARHIEEAFYDRFRNGRFLAATPFPLD